MDCDSYSSETWIESLNEDRGQPTKQKHNKKKRQGDLPAPRVGICVAAIHIINECSGCPYSFFLLSTLNSTETLQLDGQFTIETRQK